jgi:transcriptional regulator with XRE-family HTH domain
MRQKEYRDAYVGSQIRMTLPLQIRGLRKSLGEDWTQRKLAERAGMAQPRISELETPGERKLTIETLLRLASAFDVALQVRFVPFSELIDWSEGLDVDNFSVQPFEFEVAEAERSAIMAIPKKPAVRTAATGGAFQAAGNTGMPKQHIASVPENMAFSKGDQSGTFGNLASAGAGLY